ncbi:MAG: hypothetical protein AAB116_07335 [Candidatus Poribacteria bacterium]
MRLEAGQLSQASEVDTLINIVYNQIIITLLKQNACKYVWFFRVKCENDSCAAKNIRSSVALACVKYKRNKNAS